MQTPERPVLSSPILNCSLVIEELSPQGGLNRSTKLKNCKFILGRNEFRDILIRIEAAKNVFQFIATNFQLHMKFWKEGKSTIYLKNQFTRLMIANAPPDTLLKLLKILSVKTDLSENKENVISVKQKFLSNQLKQFDEISPMTLKECESLRARKGLVLPKPQDANVPGASPVSSKRKADGSIQNDSSAPCKKSRLLNPTILNLEQRKVIVAVQSGANVFFTGSAGTGKSFLLKKIIGSLPPDVTAVTASTGIAACHIGGTTLHSFAGIGSGAASIEQCYKLASRKSVAQIWRQCKYLIIDEISMVEGHFFTKMEGVARFLRKNDKPFGGIQLILCGDFLQLPPVTKRGEKRNFCFQSDAWDSCIQKIIELRVVKRQDDQQFIDILQNIRIGRCSLMHEMTLKQTSNNDLDKNGIKATRLCTHKEDVDYINKIQLERLTSEARTFMSLDSDPSLKDSLDRVTPVSSQLVLKKEAQVMLMKNLDVTQGLVNGARGVIESFSPSTGNPIVKFVSGIIKEIYPERWMIKNVGGMAMNRRQIPLKLAWAFSIHKSQGMTLDCVQMSLAKVFESGQAYVALSRARNLKSLRIIDFNSSCIKADGDVIKFYNNINS